MLLPAIQVPSLVRMKPGALDRMGIYLERDKLRRVAVLYSAGLLERLMERLNRSLSESRIEATVSLAVAEASFEAATECLAGMPANVEAIVGMGGGRALDVAKYVAFLANVPFFAVPTSLSNDGFCSPQSSFTVRSKRRSLHARLPHGVIVDTQVCLQAPRELWLSGVGDLVSKITAVQDWKLAFHARGEPVNDLAALLSDSTVYQFMAQPDHNPHGVRMLGTALMLNGIAMEIAGSSRPASGSEHLISHALDRIARQPRLVAIVQQHEADRILRLLDQVGFWQYVHENPFDRDEWLQAIELAAQLRPERYTIVSRSDVQQQLRRLIDDEPVLRGCFSR